MEIEAISVSLNIVLVEPEIPPNTGNIARLCAATQAKLHLIQPLGFSIDDKHLKRAGLDYWHLLDIALHDNWPSFVSQADIRRCFFLSTKSQNSYVDIQYRDGDYLIFGPETRGLSAEIRNLNPNNNLRIPMIADARSLNLSNSVAIVLYEALRQLNFVNLN